MAAQAALDKKAEDVRILDLSGISPVADYFVLCTTRSDAQVKAVTDSVSEALEKAGARFFHREGTADTGWILMDYGDVIVHVFKPSEREYYDLERLWAGAKVETVSEPSKAEPREPVPRL